MLTNWNNQILTSSMIAVPYVHSTQRLNGFMVAYLINLSEKSKHFRLKQHLNTDSYSTQGISSPLQKNELSYAVYLYAWERCMQNYHQSLLNSIFSITPNSWGRGIEPCEVWDPRHVWACCWYFASGRTTHVYINGSR